MFEQNDRVQSVLVIGGGGYVGSVLVPKLLWKGYRVTVFDLFLYGEQGLAEIRNHPHLRIVRGDLRDVALLRSVFRDIQAVIHLACVSNDPSFDLDPALGKSINFDAFMPLVLSAKESGVRRFIYASTSSVYGVQELGEVTEDAPLIPLTDYNKYKGLTEPILLVEKSDSFIPVIIRPATVCGYSPRMRLDLTVNILTNHAVNNGKITVFGGAQKRPNIHIDDMTDLYVRLLELPEKKIAGQIYNAGAENATVLEIAERVGAIVEREVPGRRHIEIDVASTDDRRSYHISSKKLKQELSFVPKKTIEDAVKDLCCAFLAGRIPNALEDEKYYNLRVMKKLNLPPGAPRAPFLS